MKQTSTLLEEKKGRAARLGKKYGRLGFKNKKLSFIESCKEIISGNNAIKILKQSPFR